MTLAFLLLQLRLAIQINMNHVLQTPRASFTFHAVQIRGVAAALQPAECLQSSASSRHLQFSWFFLDGMHNDTVFGYDQSAVAAHAKALLAEVPQQPEGSSAPLAAVAHHAELAVRAHFMAPSMHHKVVIRRDAPNLQRVVTARRRSGEAAACDGDRGEGEMGGD